MKAELLDYAPLSAELEEFQFDAQGDCLFVKFVPEDDWAWIGVFGHGGIGGSDVALSDRLAFVIASGKAYLVNLETRKPCYSTADHFLNTVHSGADTTVFIAEDGICLHVFSERGHEWSTRRVSWDGFRDIYVNGNIVRGESWSPIDKRWDSFRLELSSRIISGGSYHEYA